MKKFNKVLDVIILVLVLGTVGLLIWNYGWGNFSGYVSDTYNYVVDFFGKHAWDLEKIISVCVLAVALVVFIIYIVAAEKKNNHRFYRGLCLPFLCVIGLLCYKEKSAVVEWVKGFGDFSTKSGILTSVTIIVFALLVVLLVVEFITSFVQIGKEKVAKEETKQVEENKEAPAEEESKEETPTEVEEPVEEKVEETPVVEEEAKEEVPTEEVVSETKEEPVVAPVEETQQVEEVSKPEETTTEEVDSEESENEEKETRKTVTIKMPDGKEKTYEIKTFEDRIEAADPGLIQTYSDLKNCFLAYRKVHTRVSKTNDAFRFEGKLIGKITVAGKGLKIYLALDPLSVDSAIYHQRDASSKKKFAETPLVIKVKSPLSFRKAKVLIGLACEKAGTVKKSRYEAIDWTKGCTKEQIAAAEADDEAVKA